MATHSTDLLPAATVATGLGLFVAAGLSAVYAYYTNTHPQRGGGTGRSKDDDKENGEGKGGDADADSDAAHAKLKAKGQRESAGGGANMSEAGRTNRKVRRRRARGKGKGNDVELEVDDSERKGRGNSEAPNPVSVLTVPGDFEGAGAVPNSTHVDEIESNTGNGGKTKKKKRAGKAKAKAKKEQGNVEDGDENGKEVHGPRSGDSTDESASLFPSRSVSASTSALASSFPTTGKDDSLRASTAKVAAKSVQPRTQADVQALPTSQRRGIRSSLSLSLDTDSSWTHVDDHRRVKTRLAEPAAVADVTSSDLTSTASDSPVVERMSGSAVEDVRGLRANVAQPTLAERLVPKPTKTGVENMLERSDFPTLARVMRIRPGSNDAPVPGFSWDDYGDLIEDEGSFIIHDTDADQEDEGEWGIVKNRNNTSRPTLPTSASTSSSRAPTATTAGSSATTTKKQRQNARKREFAKSVKVETEAARLEGLAKHKRELERLHLIEQSQRGAGGKRPSGGMHAMVDERGKLVWE